MYDKQKESPYRTEQYKQLQYSKQTVIKNIETVFVYYCGKGSKYNYQDLQQKYFMELVTELFILAGRENQLNRKGQKWLTASTLYYTKGRKRPLDHNQFLQLLPGIAKVIFSEDNSPKKYLQSEIEQQKSMKNLLILLEKLHHHIKDEQLYRKGIRTEQIQQQTKQFLLKLRESLTKLYKIYFQYELNLKDKQKDYQNKSFEGYLEMMKDFQVYPKLISASQLYFIYNEVTSDGEHNHLSLLSPSLYSKTAFAKYGEHFTLTRFVESLILASHICVCKLKRNEGQEQIFSQMNMSQKQSVKLLLEYMQTMRSVKQKYCKFTKQRFSLIVYEEYAEYVGKRQQSARSSPLKTNRTNPLGQSKRSFYDIFNRIDI